MPFFEEMQVFQGDRVLRVGVLMEEFFQRDVEFFAYGLDFINGGIIILAIPGADRRLRDAGAAGKLIDRHIPVDFPQFPDSFENIESSC